MGRRVGIEPTNAGATNQSVNHFTNAAVHSALHKCNSILTNKLNKINIFYFKNQTFFTKTLIINKLQKTQITIIVS